MRHIPDDNILNDLREKYIGTMLMIHLSECHWIKLEDRTTLEYPFIFLDFRWVEMWDNYDHGSVSFELHAVIYDIVSQNEREIRVDRFSDKMKYDILRDKEEK